VFQGCAVTSRMADPPKIISDTSGSGLKAANEDTELTRVVASHDEHSHQGGTVEQLGSTTRAANAADAGERSAERYDSTLLRAWSYLNILPTKNPLGAFWSLDKWDGQIWD
jgi:hypothetical protein